MRSLVSALALLLWLPAQVAAWGSDGHEIVGIVAQARLSSAHAKQQVRQILGPNEGLKEAAIWADQVKHHTDPTQLPPGLRDDSDSVRFVLESAPGKPNSDNNHWHFANLPLDATDYASILKDFPDAPSPDDPFASPRDIVHVINVCIERLRGNAVAGFDLTPKNALRVLVHLVGDLHQPLHVGSGYFAASPLLPKDVFARDPKTIAEGHLKGDQGGNSLFYKEQPAEEIHAHWDADLVKMAMDSVNGVKHNVDAYGAFLATRKPAASWTPKGAVATWAEQWANESLEAARKAYVGITPTDVKEHEFKVFFGHQPPKSVMGYPVALAQNYDTDNKLVVQDQLAKAGFRLARLLDAIWP